MRKLLSIVLALTLVLTSLPVFANQFAIDGNSNAENLKHFGFISGGTGGDLMLDKTLTRAEFAALICKITGNETNLPADATLAFSDAAKIPVWAVPFVAKASELGYLKGRANGTFDHAAAVKSEEVAIVLNRILGYEEAAWGTNVQAFTNNTGINLVNSNAILRKDIFDALWPAVSTPVVKDGSILGVTVGKLEQPKPAELAIVSAETSNLKEIFVTFNQEVDKENLGTFTLNNKAAVASASVMEDGVTVVLVVKNNLVDQKEYTLTAEKTKAVAEGVAALAKTEVKFATLDKERPTVEKVEFTGPKHVTVTFSEPVKTVGKPEVRSEKVKQNVDFNSIELDGRKATFKIYGTFKEGTEYKILVKDFKDFNGLQNIEKEVDLVFNKVSETPTVKIVEASQTDMVVEFSTPVTGLKPSLFHHTFTKYVAYGLEDMDEKAVDSAKSYTKVRVLFYAESKKSDTVQPVAAGNAKFMIDGDTIKDLWGNKLGNFEEHFTVVADNEKPEVKEIKATKENEITVTYTKNVVVDKNKSFSVTLDKKDIFKSATHSGKKTVITLNGKYSGKVVTIEIDKVKDTSVNENKLVPYTGTVEIGDTTSPTITSVSFKDDSKPAETGGTFYVQFSEDMDSTTALNVMNYQLQKAGAYTTLAGDAEFYDGASIVAIKLDKDLYAKAKAAATLIVSNVKDLAGNVIKDTDKVKTISNQTLENALKLETVATNGVVATSLRTVVLTFNQEIESCTNEAITVTNGGNTKNSKFVEIEGNKVTATFENDITAFDTANISVTTVGYKKADIKGRLGSAQADVNGLVAVDKIKPVVIEVVKKDNDEITIKFNKELKQMLAAVDNLIANDVKIFAKDNADSEYRQLDAFVKKEISFGEISDGGKTLDVTIDITKVQLDSPFKVVVKDAEYVVSKTAENALADVEFVSKDNDGDAEAFDFKKPVVTSVKTMAVDSSLSRVTVEITFSEKVLSVAGALAVGDVTLDGNDASEQPTLSADGTVLTAKFAIAHYDQDKILSVVAGKFKDAAENQNLVQNYKLKVKADSADDVWELQ